MDLGKDILAQHKAHVSQRQIIEHFYDDAFRYTLPHRGQQFLKSGNDPLANANTAQSDKAVIFDSTAIDAVRLLASSIISGLTPSNSQWFQLEVNPTNTKRVSYDGRVWLQTASATLFKQVHTSNYNASALDFFQDIAIAGQAGLFIDKEHGGDFHFEVWSLGTMYVSESKKTGLIDTVYRSLQMSVGEAVEEFGKDKLPDSLQDVYKNNPYDLKKFEFIHGIRPRIKHGKQTKGKFSKDLPFESVYVCAKSGTVVKESGFHEFPVAIPRWSTIPGSAYALGPINDALPDIKTINKVKEMDLQAKEMGIAGSYVAKWDGILTPNNIVIGPRRINFAADTRNLVPLPASGNFKLAKEEIMDLRAQIKSIMMADQLEPIKKNYASATEVTVRSQIIRQVLGPVYSRLQSEFLAPFLERCFGLALRDGSLGQRPEGLEGMGILPAYQSPMARAMRMEDVSAMDTYEQGMANFAQINPKILDLYDADKAYRLRAELLGVPVDLIRSEDAVSSNREQQAKAEAEQQEAEQAMALQQQ